MNVSSSTLVRALALSALLTLAACGSEAPSQSAAPSSTPATAENANPAPAGETTADTTAADDTAADDTAPATDTETDAIAEEAAPASDNDNDADTAEETDAAQAAAETAPASIVAPEGPEPRLGTDYRLVDPPQMLAAVPGKVEIAEVFSYTCIHCARLDRLIPEWKASLPEQVNFVYAPMAHGASEPIARGFFAAQAMGVLDQTHSGMFKALAEQNRFGSGKLDDIAKLYAELGVDEKALKATANSFTVNTQISRTQRTLARWAIESTPNFVVAGKYVVIPTGDRGHEGMLQTARWLAQKEIMEQAQAD